MKRNTAYHFGSAQVGTNLECMPVSESAKETVYQRWENGKVKGLSLIHILDEKYVSWKENGVEYLRSLGFATASMAISDDSVSISDLALKREEKLAIILGTEGDGLSEKTIADSDYTVKIPMSPGVDSLNVAAASAVAFWELTRE